MAFKLKVTVGGKDFVKTVSAASKTAAQDMLPAFVVHIKSGELERQKVEAKKLSEQPTVAEYAVAFLDQHVSQDADRAATRTAYGCADRRRRSMECPARPHVCGSVRRRRRVQKPLSR